MSRQLYVSKYRLRSDENYPNNRNKIDRTVPCAVWRRRLTKHTRSRPPAKWRRNRLVSVSSPASPSRSLTAGIQELTPNCAETIMLAPRIHPSGPYRPRRPERLRQALPPLPQKVGLKIPAETDLRTCPPPNSHENQKRGCHLVLRCYRSLTGVPLPRTNPGFLRLAPGRPMPLRVQALPTNLISPKTDSANFPDPSPLLIRRQPAAVEENFIFDLLYSFTVPASQNRC